jgi:LmbE family N-acetylglucosaminyl deacetylase
MKFLFLFAHPDDETIGCAGTINQLVAAGHQVVLVSVTEGGAGEVLPPAYPQLQQLGSVRAVRRAEMAKVSAHLGVERHDFLGYEDGEITNKDVWGRLKDDIISLIDREKPDVMITFDHTGWYFHLDHVGISIAATWAYKESHHRTSALLLSELRVKGSKWEYMYPILAPSHFVLVSDISHKLTAIKIHASQDLHTVETYVRQDSPHREWYQLAFADAAAKNVLQQLPLFQAVDDGVRL